jgi:hypothetical protein
MNQRQRYELVIDQRYDIGPLMADLKPFAWLKSIIGRLCSSRQNKPVLSGAI